MLHSVHFPSSVMNWGFVVSVKVGVWGRMNSLFQELFGLDGISPVMYFGVVAALGLIELVIFTLCASVGAMIYNAAARLVGGLRVRLER